MAEWSFKGNSKLPEPGDRTAIEATSLRNEPNESLKIAETFVRPSAYYI
jgi:hypothetical protein